MARATSTEGPHAVDLHVGRRIFERRLARGHNQSELAHALGLTFQQVQKYEKGANRVSASKLWDISRFLEVEIGYFFEGFKAAGREGEQDLTAMSSVEAPTTRATAEISRLAPRMSVRQQKMVLEFCLEMRGNSTD